MNADDVAGAVASALNASRLILMTETGGITGEDGNLISSLSRLEAEGLKKSKILKGAMVPKLEVCLNTLKNGVFATHLVNLHADHGILLELLTKDRIGTLIYNTESTFNFEDFEFDDC
jgi:acetylglutamate kinase